MDHVQLLPEYKNMIVNNGGDVCYCYYFDVNHALLLSSGKKEENSERKKKRTFCAQ